MADGNCALCGQAAKLLNPGTYGRKLVNRVACETCGEYFITVEAEAEVRNPDWDASKRAMLSGVTRERSEQDSPIVICSSAYEPTGDPVGIRIDEILAALVPHTIPERIDRALQNLARRSRHPGDEVEVDRSRDWPLFFAENDDALDFTLQHMIEAGLINKPLTDLKGGGAFALTVKGWDRIEGLRHVRPETRQAFIAMWFDPQLDDAYEKGLGPAIKDAGYKPMRVDMTQFNERIDDRIIAEIRRSRFLVADVTEHRQPVYFEAGFAMGLGLPVIFTCRSDHIGACNFDTRQYNHIVWESPEDLKEKLKNRIDATIV